jgi:hypothetical protein
MKRRIAFFGPLTSGKTLFAEIIRNNLDAWHLEKYGSPVWPGGNDVKIHRFAGPFKDMLRAIGIDPNDKLAKPDILCGKTVREAMQSLGTAWGRNEVGMNFWTNILLSRVEEESRSDFILVDDLRFPNEHEALVKAGFLIVKIVRPHNPNPPSALTQHESEVYFSRMPYHYLVGLPEGIEEVERKAREFTLNVIFNPVQDHSPMIDPNSQNTPAPEAPSGSQ